MQTLLRIWCWLRGKRCSDGYVPHRDPLVRRYARLELGIEREARQWHPRDLIDPR